MNVQLMIPSYSGRVHYSLMQAVTYAVARGDVFAMSIVPGCSVLPMARAKLAATLSDAADAALMIDDDTILESDSLVQMTDSWSRLKALDPGAVAMTAVVAWRHAQARPSTPGAAVCPEAREAEEAGYANVLRVGLGALIVDAAVLRMLLAGAPAVQYGDETYPNLFPFVVWDGRFLGEDWVFSERLLEVGRIYEDSALQFGHAERW